MLILLVLVLLVPAALYIPLVQDYAVSRTLEMLNDNDDDLHYDLGKLRLKFLLDIELQDFCLTRPSSGDTVLYVRHLHTSLDELPWGERDYYRIGSFAISEVQADIDSTLVQGLSLCGSMDTLLIQEVLLSLDSSTVSVDRIRLSHPHFDVSYASSDSTEEKQDSTQSDPWRVALGTLSLDDVALHYDGWQVDSLNVSLERFSMNGLDMQLNRLDVSLPESYVRLVGQMHLDYEEDTLTGSAKTDLDLYLSRRDVLHIVEHNIPNLAANWPDSSDVEARLSSYLTPDTLIVSPLYLSIPGYVDIRGRMGGRNPFDQAQRFAEADLSAVLTHVDELMTAILGSAEERGYRIPDSLSLNLHVTQDQSRYDADMILWQDSLARLNLNGRYDDRTEEYWADLGIQRMNLSDYVPEQEINELTMSLTAHGRHFDFQSPKTTLNASLQLDTVSYRMISDSTEMVIEVDDISVTADVYKDTMRVHGDLNMSVSDLGYIRDFGIDFLNARNRMELDAHGGDAELGVAVNCDLFHLTSVLDRFMKELDAQIKDKAFDINAIQRTLPNLSVKANMRQSNPIAPILKLYGVSFEGFSALLTNSDSLRLDLAVDTLRYEDIQLRRVSAALSPNEDNYNYMARVLYDDTITGKTFDLDVNARLLSDSILASGMLRADTMDVFDFDACLAHRIQAHARLATMPLSMANGFLGEGLKLSGYLNGGVSLDCDSLDLNALEAAIWFDSASVWYEGCDMTLGLPQDSIVYRGGELSLDHIRFMTANERPITIDGKVDMRKDMANPDIDLMILSDNAQIIRNKRRRTRGQFIYGTLPLSTKVSVLGTLDDLKVMGQVAIPAGCDLTYYYEDDGLIASSSQLNGLVEFVQFAQDTLVLLDSIQIPVLAQKPNNMEVNLDLKIDPSTQIMAYIPTGTEDHLMVKGGGNLKMSVNGNGDLRLSGGYDVSDGNINFTLPMLPVTKQFALTKDSWLRWTGAVDQPELNLSATEGVKCTINDATSGARVVKFVISILIRGTLENMDVVFDCSAPDDAAIQGELASLTAEDRSKQALLLLIAQTYTGPSASQSSAGLSSANAAINNLLNKELESLLTNKLKHTEINVGIDTYDPNGTGAQQTDYSVSVSQKFFNDRMRVTVGGKMSKGDEVQKDDASMINDASVEWLIKKDGSQYARIFRHTNYESVLEGEVVETGVGYVQKREAYRFWQLFLRSDKKRMAARREMLKKLQEEEFLKNRQK